jgi:hypothetical protein
LERDLKLERDKELETDRILGAGKVVEANKILETGKVSGSDSVLGIDKNLEDDKILEAHEDANRQNKFGVTVIGWAIGFTGAGILLLGILSSGGAIVCWVGGGIALSGLYILRLAGRYGRVR